MANYRPRTPLQKLLLRLAPLDNAVGRSARRKLRRRYWWRARRDWRRLVDSLGPDDQVLDLGANVGSVTVELARTGAQVHAFEPDPFTFEILKKNVGHLPNVQLHNKAVAAEAGTARLRRLRGWESDPIKRSVGSTIALRGDGYQDDESVDVEVVSFWDILGQLDRPARLVKMDIEGAEMGILDAMRAAGKAEGFEHLFVEMHGERDTATWHRIQDLKRWAASFDHPDINLHWH